MKTISYRISIPKPCHEDWDKMLPEARGRFCMACQKSVTDFSAMNDAEIVDFVHNHTNVCGHVASDQLNRPITAQIYQPKTTHWWQAVALLVFSLFANRTLALPNHKTETTTQQPYQNRQRPDAFAINGPDRDTASQIIELKGKVVDSTSDMALPGTQVLIYKNGERIAYAITDTNGRFEIKIKAEDSLVLVCSHFAYTKERMENIRKSNLDLVIGLKGSVEIVTERQPVLMAGGMEATICEVGTIPYIPGGKLGLIWYRFKWFVRSHVNRVFHGKASEE